VVTTAIAGRGTTELEWSGWLESRPWPSLDLASVSSRRVCVLAAHPDDEILGAAGLLMRLVAAGTAITLVWATDGEASHPDSTAMTPTELASLRRSESTRALSRLGVEPESVHYLGLPDGGLTAHSTQLRQDLAAIVDPEDVLVTPWSGDGHPDHEAAAEAARGLGAEHIHYPIWMWHWGTPGDERVPWDRIHVVPVDDVAAKASAINEFASQVRPIGPSPNDAAILPPHVVARFLRPVEWFLR
jgi:LmbE family N-acetylglucosaminyl deacetylase